MIGKTANAKRIVKVGVDTLMVVLFVVITTSCDIVRWQNPFVHPSAETPPYMKWVKVTGNAPVFPRINFSATVFDGSIWIAGGRDKNDDELRDIWSSSDGREWQQITDNSPSSTDFAFASFDGNLFMYTGTEVLYYSADGVDWSNSVPDPFDNSSFALRLMEMDGLLWAACPETGRVWSSEDPT